jgi:hypothetical protein
VLLSSIMSTFVHLYILPATVVDMSLSLIHILCHVLCYLCMYLLAYFFLIRVVGLDLHELGKAFSLI